MQRLSELTGLSVAAVRHDPQAGWALELDDGRLVALGSKQRLRKMGYTNTLGMYLSEFGGRTGWTQKMAEHLSKMLPRCVREEDRDPNRAPRAKIT